MRVCMCCVFPRKQRLCPMRASLVLGTTWFPGKSIPWKASFVSNEGLLGTTWFPVESILCDSV